ncbi:MULTISPECIES: FGGY-family carbohydrate kinase [unclassified Rhizobium]|uniref:FGGY-family carbohydrate kinase n=1 Tax=unclassified Rhizobium TaxID=2613769 RepID=UPI000714CCC7|nr:MULTISPECIES: FGGY-family carbohydrate kinase [unclassified Rhizobium]KQS90905.1 carbohydrate kinase [Rhizobium sp. Leaf391]KQS95993.1 carbohydrate kinase [Rhizobium sp. Leaf386]KQU09932.1 carbohydrate kinase [Rhizobium sp. Leaf453]
MRIIAVIDIGKTNAKVALVDLDRFEEIAVRKIANGVSGNGLYPHFDVERLWRFIAESLAALHAETPIDAISVTTHGATAVLLDANGDLALPLLDYEFTAPDTLSADYDKVRPPFAETGAARLPMGLNIGAQIYWQQQTYPEHFANVATILTYAQYWSYRLSGVLANELTSLGCHTDLWNPYTGDFSTMVDERGWRPLFAPVRRASDLLGGLTAQAARDTGLPEGLPVFCGIHDSNSSLLPHVLTRPAPFSVVSTGTWVVIMAMGARKVALDEARDTLINVNALGDPVPSARFMGGRAFSILMKDQPVTPSVEAEAAVVDRLWMLLPSLPEGSGPFPQTKARWTCDESSLMQAERLAVVSFHLALMTATCLDLIGAEGEIVVEGPFAGNPAYLRMLAAATGRPVLIGSQSATGTSLGAACLADGSRAQVQTSRFSDETSAGYQAYAEKWFAEANRSNVV